MEREMDRLDWSQLFPENLDLILQKLSLFTDFLAFGQVCTSWRSVFMYRRPSIRPPPCMLLTSPDDSGAALPLFVLHGGKLRKLRTRVQFFPRERIVGSSMGWLVLGFLDRLGLHLMNPLSSKRIRLPCMTSSGNSVQSGCFPLFDVTMSSAPTADGCTLVARGWHESQFLWCRLGDEEWTTCPVPLEIDVGVADIMFHDAKLYVLSNQGEILVYSFDPRPNMISKCSILGKVDYNFHFWRLVGSGSEILTLAQYSPPVKDCVFKQEDDGKWMSVDSLGDRVILKGNHGVISLDVKDLSGMGFEAGCMYYGRPKEPPALKKVSLANHLLFGVISIPLTFGYRAQRAREFEWILPQVW